MTVSRMCRSTTAVVALTLLALAACSPSEGGHVASPPPDATPMHVVQAFVDAVNAQDADLVRDLSLHDSSGFTTWVENGWILRDATVDQEWTVPYADDPMRTEVFVTFDPSDADSSFERGETTTWSFLLAREGRAGSYTTTAQANDRPRAASHRP